MRVINAALSPLIGLFRFPSINFKFRVKTLKLFLLAILFLVPTISFYKIIPLGLEILKFEISPQQNIYRFSRVHRAFYASVDLRKIQHLKRPDFEALLRINVPRSLKRGFDLYIRKTIEIAQKYQVDPFWVVSIMWTESHFNQQALSLKGATGLMQIMPATGIWLSERLYKAGKATDMDPLRKGLDLRNGGVNEPFVNIEMGVYYLKKLLKMFDHNYTYATVAYNMGPAWVQGRLRRRGPVGVKNNYLIKVHDHYKKISEPYKRKARFIKILYPKTYIAKDMKINIKPNPNYLHLHKTMDKYFLTQGIRLNYVLQNGKEIDNPLIIAQR